VTSSGSTCFPFDPTTGGKASGPRALSQSGPQVSDTTPSIPQSTTLQAVFDPGGCEMPQVKFRRMCFGMAVRTKQDAFGEFLAYRRVAAVRKRAHVKLEMLLAGLDVMPGQGRKVPRVSARRASPACFLDEGKLALQSTRLLAEVGLVSVICIGVLACARAEPSLPSPQGSAACHACTI
jgi:hypothetical protein